MEWLSRPSLGIDRRSALSLVVASCLLATTASAARARHTPFTPGPGLGVALRMHGGAQDGDDVASVDAATRLWMKTVTSGSHRNAPAKTSALYAPDAVLWGTVAEDVRDTPEDIRAYFDYFAAIPNLKVVDGSYNAVVQVMGDSAVSSGHYTFSYPGPRGKLKLVPARFTFVYRLNPAAKGTGTMWEIVNHHSSALPEQPEALGPPVEDDDDKSWTAVEAPTSPLDDDADAGTVAASAVGRSRSASPRQQPARAAASGSPMKGFNLPIKPLVFLLAGKALTQMESFATNAAPKDDSASAASRKPVEVRTPWTIAFDKWGFGNSVGWSVYTVYLFRLILKK